MLDIHGSNTMQEDQDSLEITEEFDEVSFISDALEKDIP